MATPKSVGFYTLGCKLNYSETSSIQRQFEEKGYLVLPFDKGPDVFVVNTCSVTDFADRKCRKIVRKALHTNPNANVIITGCYAQLKPREIADIPGVDLVLGAKEKFHILDYIDHLQGGATKGMIYVSQIEEANHFIPAYSIGNRTRSFLKVQDGCNYSCTFCTIPKARGKSRSAPISQLVRQAEMIAQSGVKEIVLTGVNIGDFGNGTHVIEERRPSKEALFIDLIRALDKVEGIRRYRISSIEPNLLTPEIVDFVRHSSSFLPHFHIPLQSGSDKILRRMKRRYLRQLFADRIALIRRKMPDACIGVDVIVGFPGETEEDFRDSFRFIRELDINYLHVFTYSERANTPAADMQDSVPLDVRRLRNAELRSLSERKRILGYQKYLGTTRNVLVEASKIAGHLSGFTDNYIKVLLPSRPEMINTIQPVRLLDLHPDGFVTGEFLSKEVHV